MLPEGTLLPSRKKLMPYVIVTDDAFGLTQNMMKPYAGLYDKRSSQRIFNGRLDNLCFCNMIDDEVRLFADIILLPVH